jgi:hypothetical protein
LDKYPLLRMAHAMERMAPKRLEGGARCELL